MTNEKCLRCGLYQTQACTCWTPACEEYDMYEEHLKFQTKGYDGKKV